MIHRVLVEIYVDDWDGTPEEIINNMCRDWSTVIDDWYIFSSEEVPDEQ